MVSVSAESSGLLVKPDVALSQMDSEALPAARGNSAIDQTGTHPVAGVATPANLLLDPQVKATARAPSRGVRRLITTVRAGSPSVFVWNQR
jgi:hypothetical protein